MYGGEIETRAMGLYPAMPSSTQLSNDNLPAMIHETILGLGNAKLAK
jgi:hypothetical protein